MNKEINDNDRIIIGVREWALRETLRSIDPWIHPDRKEIKEDAGKVIGFAQKLEEYVLGGIVS